MPVLAQRFKFSDNTTNVAVADFTDVKTSDLFNSPNNVLKDVNTDLAAFLEKSNAAAALEIKKPDTLDDLARISKDSWTSVKDISKLNSNDLNKYTEGLFPDNLTATASFKKLSQSCKTSSSGHYNSGKPFDTSVNCNGNNRASQGGCSSGINDILNKLSNGNYNAAFKDLNSALSNLVSLATMGYKANMCGVFNALSGGLPNLVQSRGAGMLLGTLGSTGNLRGVFDLASSTGSSGYSVAKDNPSGIANVFANYKTPFDSKQTEYSTLADTTDLSMTSFDSKWNKSSYDDIASCSVMPSATDDYQKVLKAKSMIFSVDEDNLDFVPTSSNNLMRVGTKSLGRFF